MRLVYAPGTCLWPGSVGAWQRVCADSGRRLARLATNSDFLEFYRTYRCGFVSMAIIVPSLRATTLMPTCPDLFDETTCRTMQHHHCRLFFGVCAQEAVGVTAELAVGYYIQHGHAPDKRTLVKLYYGEPVGSVDLFIGFDKLCVFRYAVVSDG